MNYEVLSHFETLRISPTDDWRIIKEAAHNLLRITHPDKGGNVTDFFKIQKSYDFLKEHRQEIANYFSQRLQFQQEAETHQKELQEIQKRNEESKKKYEFERKQKAEEDERIIEELKRKKQEELTKLREEEKKRKRREEEKRQEEEKRRREYSFNQGHNPYPNPNSYPRTNPNPYFPYDAMNQYHSCPPPKPHCIHCDCVLVCSNSSCPSNPSKRERPWWSFRNG